MMKTFLSIGTGPGMGLATAERFAQAGYRVVLSARTRAKLDVMATELNSRGYAVQVKIVVRQNAGADHHPLASGAWALGHPEIG